MASGTSLHGVFLDFDSLLPDDLDVGALLACVDQASTFAHTAAADVPARIASADVVFTNKVPLDAAAFAAAPRLKLVVVLATGTNVVDVEAAARAGITVCNNVAYSGTDLVEHTLMLMLALTRCLPAYQADVHDGIWSGQSQFSLLHRPIRQLAGKTLGIIGLGHAGRGVADVGCALGMAVVALQSSRPGHSDQPIPRLDLGELLDVADVLSIHCPLTVHTRNLLDYPQLKRMKRSALLVNTARGGIVNEAGLARALEDGLIAGAGVDVLTHEPPPGDHPLLVCDHPNLIVTPHNAWGSRESRQALVNQSADLVHAWRRGNPRNVVCP